MKGKANGKHGYAIAAIAAMIAAIGCITACSLGGDVETWRIKAFGLVEVQFDNLEQFPATVYKDVARQLAAAEIAANGSVRVKAQSSPEGTAFYPTFYLDLFDMPDITLACKGPAIVTAIEAGKANPVRIPKLEAIEVDSAYVKITNNSDFSLALRQGDAEKSPLGGGPGLIVSGKTAVYEITPGPVSGCAVMRNTTTPVDFPAGLAEFRRGIIYVFQYDGTKLNAGEEKSVLQTIPPAAPQNVRAEALSATSIRISWDEVYGAMSYNIRSSAAEDAFLASTGTPSITITRLTPGQTYYYTVSAISSGDRESAQSGAVFATTFPGNLRVSAVTASGASLVWNTVNAASAYNVYRSTSANGIYSKINPAAINKNAFTDTGLSPYTTYYYTISAIVDGLEGERSSVVSVTTLLSAPANVTAGAQSASSITLAWNEVNWAGGYNVYRSASENGTYSKVNTTAIAALSYSDMGLASYTVYYYKICAVTNNIEGEKSNTVSSGTLMAAPGNVRVTVITSGSISLAWNAVSAADGYNVYRSASENGTYNKLNVAAISGTASTDTDLSPSTSYYYKISAIGGGVEGMLSSAVPGITLMPAPLNVTASAQSASSITLAWNEVNGAGGYNVYRSASENGNYSKVNSAIIAAVSYSDTGLASSTVYFYKICAVTNSVEGEKSNTVSTVTLMAAPDNVQAAVITTGSVSLAWNAVSGASGYNMYRSGSETGTYSKVNTGAINGTGFTDASLSQYTSYYYKLSAISNDGMETAPSSPICVTTGVLVTAVSGLAPKLAWIQSNAASNTLYIIEIIANENIGPQTLSYSGKTGLTILLKGLVTTRAPLLPTPTLPPGKPKPNCKFGLQWRFVYG